MEIQEDLKTDTPAWESGESQDHQELPRGTSLGRYVIIEPIGMGGMGAIYRAYDPELNRGVALKILSVKQEDSQAAEKAKTRLIREAQALAQLSHPNVVAVHDVGSFGEDVFVAMELVEGNTIQEWMKEKNKSIREILEVMTAAGRGLSAAHKAGLVHRDFKPANVIVGDDGRVRVLDFGLARAVDEGTEEDTQNLTNLPNDMEISSSCDPNLLQTPLTREGSIVGTPLYMAPEQHLGQKTDERTDQFSFCLVLYEALYGKRPFEGKTIKELTQQVIKQQLVQPPSDATVPVWLWQIIRKGLQANLQKRYPSMETLLADLDNDPDEVRRQHKLRHRRKLLLIVLTLLMVAIPIGVWYGLRYRTVQLCKAAQGEFVGIWDHATKALVQKAFLSTKKTFALGTWKSVERTIERYLAGWMQMRSDICEARLVRATQSEELFDLRMNCLSKRLVELQALVKVFVKADTKVMRKAAQATSSLAGMEICANEQALRAPYPPPKTAEEKGKVAAIRKELAEVEAYRKTGKYREGVELSKKLKEQAKIVAYRPVIAEVLYYLGVLQNRVGEYKNSETTLLTAAREAGKSRDGLLAAKAMIGLVRVVGYQQKDHKLGLSIGRDAEIMLDVVGGDKLVQASLLNNRGIVFHDQGELDKALGHYRKAQTIFEENLGPEHPEGARVLNHMGIVFWQQGEYDKALEFFRRALAINEKMLGRNHPDLAPIYNNMGLMYRLQGKYEEALEAYSNTLAMEKKLLGPKHPIIAKTLNNIGFVYRHQSDYTRAMETFQSVLAIRKNALGPEHPNVAQSLNNVGLVFQDQGKTDQALEHHEKALAIQLKVMDHKHPDLAPSLNNIGRVLSDQGEHEKSLEYLHKAVAIWEPTLGPDHPFVAESMSFIGKNLLHQGKPNQTLKPLERVVAICKEKICDSDIYGQGLFYIAQALMAINRDKQRAIGLAKQARKIWGKNSQVFGRELQEVNAWLTKNENGFSTSNR